MLQDTLGVVGLFVIKNSITNEKFILMKMNIGLQTYTKEVGACSW
jgi:hypothetical protein